MRKIRASLQNQETLKTALYSHRKLYDTWLSSQLRQETLSQQILPPPEIAIIYCEEVWCKSLFSPATACHAFIDILSSSWKWDGESETSYGFWVDNRGQIRYAQYCRLWFNPSMDNWWTFSEREEPGLDSRWWGLIQTWERLKVELTATTVAIHNHNMEGEKKIKFCRTKLMDLRSIKMKKPIYTIWSWFAVTHFK